MNQMGLRENLVESGLIPVSNPRLVLSLYWGFPGLPSFPLGSVDNGHLLLGVGHCVEPQVSQRILEPSAEENTFSSCEVCVVQIALRNILPFWKGGSSFFVWPNLGSLSCDPPGDQIHSLTAGGTDVPGRVLTLPCKSHFEVSTECSEHCH